MRPDEVEKYQACYEHPNYRMGKRRVLLMQRDIESIPHGTYLDVGCGRGETVAYARQRGLQAQGLEIVPELLTEHVVQGDITAMPFTAVDYVSCYDVLEHLPFADVGPALDELFRVAKKKLFISTTDHPHTFYGMDLHLTRKPKDWWEAQFLTRGEILHCDDGYNTENCWHWIIKPSPNQNSSPH